MDKLEDMSDCESEALVIVLGVADMLVSPPSVVTEFCDGFSCGSDWSFVEAYFFFLQKAFSFSHSCAERDVV